MVIAIYLLVLVAAFYFLIVRPQRRQQMLRRQMIATVGVGDEIVTSGGVHGTVVALAEETLDLEVAPGIVLKIARGAVAQRLGDEPPALPDANGANGGNGATDADGAEA